MNNVKSSGKPKGVVKLFTDDMHKSIFVFQDGLSNRYTSKGGKVIDTVKVRSSGATKGSRRFAVR